MYTDAGEFVGMGTVSGVHFVVPGAAGRPGAEARGGLLRGEVCGEVGGEVCEVRARRKGPPP